MDTPAGSTSWAPYVPAIFGLVGAVIGSVGSSLTTIYISRRQQRDNLQRDLSSLRQGLYQKMSSTMAETQRSVTMAIAALKRHNADPQKYPSTSTEAQELHANFALVREALNGAGPVLPKAIFVHIEDFRVKMIEVQASADDGSLTPLEMLKRIEKLMYATRTKFVELVREQMRIE